jgi:stage II sporulation protein D
MLRSKDLSIRQVGDKILIQGIEFLSPVVLEPTDGFISVNKRPYRGKIKLSVSKDFKVINIVDLEEYLYGVLKMEISPSWHFEVLKAQAVIARTFAITNLEKHKKEGFNLCSNAHCQVYGGVNAEDPLMIKAVNETKGQIIVFDGLPVFTPYHATCGGHTSSSKEIWIGGKSLPYLKGVKCSHCVDSPHYHWSCFFSFKELRRLLRKKYNLGVIYSIYSFSKNSYGRTTNLLVLHSRGKLRLNANEFRLLVGSLRLKSTFFSISMSSNGVRFKGRGWGHSVGVCQWGAKKLAEKGMDYRGILGYYYKGVQLSRINKYSKEIKINDTQKYTDPELKAKFADDKT